MEIFCFEHSPPQCMDMKYFKNHDKHIFEIPVSFFINMTIQKQENKGMKYPLQKIVRFVIFLLGRILYCESFGNLAVKRQKKIEYAFNGFEFGISSSLVRQGDYYPQNPVVPNLSP